MPNYTPNLNLFKYDTTKDGKEVFSIEKALNENWDKLDKGGSSSGLKIGTIMQGFIDESQNKERYLNGGVIVQDQFVSFTSWIKNIVKLYPSLKVTEDQWQAELKLSAKGQCGKFVIDDAKNVIRLPKVVNIQGLFDLTQSGMLKEAGLPNITGTGGIQSPWTNANQNGAIEVQAEGRNFVGGQIWQAVGIKLKLDASKSNPLYGKSDTVQEEAVQYPYYIVVATGSKDSIDVIREAELNNPFTLFECKWSDKLLNNISWLRSNGQWNAKEVYTDAYDYLLKEYNSGTEVTEEISGISITYKKGKDSNIRVTTDTNAYNQILAKTGTVWFYVLNLAENKFLLPQSNAMLQFGGEGNFVEAGLPNHTHKPLYVAGSNSDLGDPGNLLMTNPREPNGVKKVNDSKTGGVVENAIYGKSDTVQPNAVKGYLYFYVGETVQNVNLINAGRIEETLVNKADVSGDNVTIIPRTEDYFFAFSIQKGLVQQVPDNMYIRCSATNNNTNDIFIVVDCCNADGSSNFGLFHFNKGGNPSSKCIFWSPLFKKGSYIKVKDIRGGADNINLRGYYVQKHN